MRGLPAIAAEEGAGDAKFAGLAGYKGGLGVVSGHENGVHAGGANGGELGFEVLVALGVFLLEGDLSAIGEEALLEVFCQADGVGGGDGSQDGDAFGLECFFGELGHYGALKRVNEADTEDVVADGGDLWVGGGRRDHRDLRALGDGGHLEGAAGGDLAEEGDDLFAGEELAGNGGGFAGLRLIILGEELKGAAEHAASGVDVFDGEECASVGRVAKRGFFARKGGNLADFNRLGGGEDGGCESGAEAGEQSRFHGEGEAFRET